MKKQVIKGKVPRVNPRSKPMPSKVHQSKKALDRQKRDFDMDQDDQQFEEGDRIVLVKMGEDPDPVPSGTTGVVTHVTDMRDWDGSIQLGVNWDNGRRLNVILPVDRVRKL